MRKTTVIFIIIALSIAPFFEAGVLEVSAAEGPNLVPNASLETADGTGSNPASWARGRWGTNQAIFTYPVPGFSSTRAAKVEITSYTSGDAKWYFSNVTVAPGKTYKFADDSISNVSSFITVRYRMGDGSFRYQDIAQVAPTGSVQRVQVNFIVPSGVQNLTVFHLIKSVGFLTVDNFELREITPDEPPPPPDPSNLVPNPSLETPDATGASPESWSRGRWGTNQTKFSYPVGGLVGSRAAKVEISSYTSGDAKWYFREISARPGASYEFSNVHISDIPSFVTVQVRLADNSFRYIDLANLPPAASPQTLTRTFTVPANATSLIVFHLIKGVGFLTVDNYSLREVSAGDPSKFSEGFVSLNFDDGWRSIYENAIPILNRAGLKSSQLIVTDRFDFPAYMDENQVLDMFRGGHEIASHTRTHRDLSGFTEEEIRDEVTGSKSDLEALLGQVVKTFAYPFGGYNTLTDRIVKEAGYMGARTSDGGFNTKNGDPYLLKRQGMHSDTTFSQVKNWIDTARSDKLWLILVFHRVDNSGTQFSASPELLQQIVDYLVSRGIPVRTNSEGVALMSQ